jgi:ABC-type branched-subunit amino acid transport system substrate-binding protein
LKKAARKMISVLLTTLMGLVTGMTGVSYAQAAKEIKIGVPHPLTGWMAEGGDQFPTGV